MHPGQTITDAQASDFLRQDVENAEDQVENAVQVVLTPNQFSALVSFQYNTGAPATATIYKLINSRQFLLAAQEFEKWVYSGGRVMYGLVRRRRAERALFELR